MNNGNGQNPPLATTRSVWKKTLPDSATVLKVTSPQMLIQCWPWVRGRLERIKRKDKSAGRWMPEHIRHAVFEGLHGRSLAELFLAVDNDGVIYNFVVTFVKVDPFVQLPLTLHIWAGDLNRTAIERFTPWFETLCRERGLTAIEFETGRGVAWMEALRKARSGFKLKQMIFRMEVE